MRLFISYARVDKPLCKQVHEHLEAVHEVWYDKRLHAGMDWWLEIQERLAWCEGFVYLLSPESVASEYCQKEYAIAVESGKHIFPVLIQARTKIPESLGHIHYADLSEGMEDIITLMNALTIAERRQRKPAPPPIKPIVKPDKPPKDISPTQALAQAADAMEVENFDSAVFIIKQALEKKPTGRIQRLLQGMLAEAESALERQMYLREAAREYAPIRELITRTATRDMGCAELLEFQRDFPDYDPDNLVDICTDAMKTGTPRRDPTKPTPPTINPTQSALQRAQNFTGKRNSDWKPVIVKLGEIDPQTPIPELEMCLVPVGKFMMGADGDQAKYDDEKPAHPQTISKPYWIARYPVTNAQWRRAVEAGAVNKPKTTKWYDDKNMQDAPVVYVDWFMSQQFAQWARCALPSEMHWEYATRGVESWMYPWGNGWEDGKRVIWKNNRQGEYPHAVTTMPEGASWVGAMHLIGNVWEWTSSEFKPYPYSADDGREQDTGNSTDVRRVLRAGSWDNNRSLARAVYRRDNLPYFRNDLFGFRLFCRPPSP